MESATRVRRSATFSKPSVSLTHSSVTSGSTLFLTACTSTSKLILDVLPMRGCVMTVGSAGTSMENSFFWPFFMPTSSASNAAGNRPVPRPYRRVGVVREAMSSPASSVAFMPRSR